MADDDDAKPEPSAARSSSRRPRVNAEPTAETVRAQAEKVAEQEFARLHAAGVPAEAALAQARTAGLSASAVLLDVVGPDATPPHQQAAIVMSVAGQPDLVLYPGINRLSSETWAAYSQHPGIRERLPPAADVDEPFVLAGDIIPITSLPRRGEHLVELIGRTYSVAGLDVLEQHEAAVSGKVPRGVVAAAIAKQRAVMAKRAKPAKPEPVKPARRRAR